MSMIQIEKYGWKYQTDKKDGKIEFNVIPPEDIKIPKTLYRYFGIGDRSIGTVLNNYLYASHPDQFNDLYDCHDELIDFDDDEATITFLAGEDKTIADRLREEMKKNRNGVIQTAQRNFRQVLYRKLGIVCFTSDANSILMWSYYTNNRGFLVEYDYQKLPFKYHGPFPINYQEELQKISVKESGMTLAVLFQSNVKHKGWERENEWRMLIENPAGEMVSPNMFPELADLGGQERKFYYDPSIIKSIVLGHYFAEPHELHIVNEQIFEMRFASATDIRSTLLAYMATHSILAGYTIRRPDLKEIGYFKGTIAKVNETTYSFTRINE